MDYSNQYYKLYCSRLAILREQLTRDFSGAQKKQLEKVLHIQQKREHLLVGTVMKEMKGRLSVFDRERGRVEDTRNYCQSDDVIYLDDETGKVPLDCQEYGSLLTQGAVVCLRGTFRATHFVVAQVIGHHSLLPTPTPDQPLDLFLSQAKSLVLLCSGLDVDQTLLMKSLQNLLCGHSVTRLASLISQKTSDLVVLGKLIDPCGTST